MPKMNIILKGDPYCQPRYYGKIEWNERDIYIRSAGGGKDSRHKDGMTYLHSTGLQRTVDTRLPTSDVSREFINYVELPPFLSEPPVFRRPIGTNDLVLQTTSAGLKPRLAVEVVSNDRLDGVLKAWKSHSSAPDVQSYTDKGLGQSLVVAVLGSLKGPPSTGGI
jgi:hypothetical protein